MNNIDKVNQLCEFGFDVIEQVLLIVGVGLNNYQYLEIKCDWMGYIIGEVEFVVVFVQGKDEE